MLPDNWLGITSLIIGALSIFCGVLGVAAIIFGVLGLNSVKQGTANNKGLCIAGLVTGTLGIIITMIPYAFAFFISSH